MYNFLIYFLYFLIYSFVGYIIEIIACSIYEKKIVNRGFLYGPICPIYGVGALLIILSLNKFNDNPIIIFFLGILITSGIEYYTSYIFERIFNNKWWDYSNRKDNINGRICIGNSIFFGIASLFLIYIANPYLSNMVSKIPENMVYILSEVFIVILIIDLISSIKIAYNLRSKIIVAEELKKEKLQMLPFRFEKKYHGQISKIKNMRNRLFNNYPSLSKNLRKELKIVSDLVNKEQSKNVKKRKKSKKK